VVQSFPDNMPEVWTHHWGFLEDETGKAAVLGEWGGEFFAWGSGSVPGPLR
jgi:hypothetical protein